VRDSGPRSIISPINKKKDQYTQKLYEHADFFVPGSRTAFLE
jgi:hypothetical protein